MELKDRVESTRAKFEELHLAWATGGLSTAQKEELEWLVLETQLVQAEALTRLAYKSW